MILVMMSRGSAAGLRDCVYLSGQVDCLAECLPWLVGNASLVQRCAHTPEPSTMQQARWGIELCAVSVPIAPASQPHPDMSLTVSQSPSTAHVAAAQPLAQDRCRWLLSPYSHPSVPPPHLDQPEYEGQARCCQLSEALQELPCGGHKPCCGRGGSEG